MTNRRDIRAVVFDCDGVMFDTLKANITYYNDLLVHCGFPPMTDSQRGYVHMHTVDESLRFLFPDPATYRKAAAHRKTLRYERYLRCMEIEPYLKPLLEAIRPVMKTAIATNRTDTMHPLLSAFGLERSFDLVVTAADVANPKPHPEQLFRVAAELGMAPEHLLYIGDSRLDEAAAAASGVLFAAYRNPELSAAYHIESLERVWEILEQLTGFQNHSAGRNRDIPR
jgi:phosphoglycolate phosphatase